jgi:hypothetical protein
LLWRQANRRVAALEERLATLEGWRSAVDVPVVARWGRVIGRELEAGTVSVRVRGESEVPVGSVAVDAGSRQLVGRVVATGPTAVSVRLITAAAGGERWLRCAVFPADGGAGLDAAGQSGLPRVDLRVAGGGRFESAPVGESGVLAAGARVRLDDASWPAEAQMLVVGVVREVRDHETPLMRVAEVVPTVDDLGAVSAVVLLTAEESDGAEPGVGSGGAG